MRPNSPRSLYPEHEFNEDDAQDQIQPETAWLVLMYDYGSLSFKHMNLAFDLGAACHLNDSGFCSVFPFICLLRV